MKKIVWFVLVTVLCMTGIFVFNYYNNKNAVIYSEEIPMVDEVPLQKTYSVTTNTNIIDVSDYGIVGDGMTDCSEAISRVIKDNVGNVIYFPTGIYIVSDSINICSNTQITGDGEATIFLAKAGKERGTGMLVIPKGSSNIELNNITISGFSQVNNGPGYDTMDGIHLLDIWKSENITISNCNFKDNIYCAVRVFGCNNLKILSSNFENVDCGIITLGEYDVNDMEITGCLINGHDKSEGISLYGKKTHNNIRIIGNVIENKTSGIGVLVSNRAINTNIVITENGIYNCAVGIVASNLTLGEIKSNEINYTTTGRGIETNSCSGVQVSGNSIEATNYDSISIKNCNNCIYSENRIVLTEHLLNKTAAAIKIFENSDSIGIVNNDISISGKKVSSSAIRLMNAGSNIVIEENSIMDGLKILQ